MTSTARSNASGSSHIAQAVPATVNTAVAVKMPVVDDPRAGERPGAERPQQNTGKHTCVLEGDDRPSPIVRRSPLDQRVERDEDQRARDPEDDHERQRRRQAGSGEADAASMTATPAAPRESSRIRPVALDRRPTHRAPTPIPIDSIMSGRPDCQSETPARLWHRPGCFGQRDSRLSRKRRRRMMANRSMRSRASANQAPCNVFSSPPSARAGGTGGIVQAALNPTSAKAGEQQWGHPDGVSGQRQQNAGCRSAGQNGKKRPHLELPVAGRQSCMRQEFRKNPVFRRAEEGAVDAHSCEDDQRQNASGRIHP